MPRLLFAELRFLERSARNGAWLNLGTDPQVAWRGDKVAVVAAVANLRARGARKSRLQLLKSNWCAPVSYVSLVSTVSDVPKCFRFRVANVLCQTLLIAGLVMCFGGDSRHHHRLCPFGSFASASCGNE